MKIGILTFHWTVNYGGVLQAYALQQTLKDLGHTPIFINYHNEGEVLKALPFYRKILHKGWNVTANLLFGRKKREKRTQIFRAEHLRISSNLCRSEEELRKEEKMDLYIVGSDQVWNPELTSNVSVYLLRFASNSPKIAYAASFGKKTVAEKYYPVFQEELAQFKKVSVREEDALALLEKMGVYGAKVVLDPVLLLSREQWKNVASICPVKQDYILCYYMPTRDSSVTSAIKTLAEQIAEKTGYRIVNIGKKEYEKLKFWECNLLESGPAEFVALFAGAKYVVTNSFHGTAFSLKNNVPFFVPVNFSIPEDKRLSNRIECLLRMFGCSERIVDSSTKIELKELPSIDFERINRVMEDCICDSVDFLKSALI